MASTGQRAFAHMLNKQGAAEVRKQIHSPAITNDVPKSTSGINLAVLPPGELITPVEFEDFVLQHQDTIDRDPFRDLLQFPEDDIEIQQVPRICRTLTPVVPDEPGADTDPHVVDCVRLYTSDYTTVVRKQEKYSFSVCNKERLPDNENIIQQEYEIDVEDSLVEQDKDNTPKRQSMQMNETPRGSWASSIFDLKQSQADRLVEPILERIPAEEVDRNNESQRKQCRQNSLFSLYPSQDEDELTARRMIPEIPREHFGHRILIKVFQMKLELDIEPIFVSLALYDAKEKKKISENFYFDMNTESTNRMINMHVPHKDRSTRSQSAIFSLTYPSPDVFLVVRLEKVLQQGEINECVEPYMKEDKIREEKHKSNAVQFCERLGKYRMPFAWTAIYLMNVISGAGSLERDSSMSSEKSEPEMSRTASLDRRSAAHAPPYENFRRRPRDDSQVRRGSLDRGRTGYEKRRSWSPDDYGSSLDTFSPVTLTVTSFFRQEGDKLSDDDLYKFLVDMKRPSSVLKRLKSISGTLKFDALPCPEEVPYSRTPELYKIYPFPEDKLKEIWETKEVQEFPSKEVYVPYTSYRNLLYVYPKHFNGVNRQGSARNIAIKVQYMIGEEESHALNVIFGKSSCPELSKEAYTSVTYHNKSPQFYEEIKVKLPAKVSKSHHLLFSFYHVSCQNKKNEPTPVEIPIGYTWLPLLNDNQLSIGDFQLPVSMEKLPPRYSMHSDSQNIKWMDNRKPLFTVNLYCASSIHTQDENLNHFLHLCHMAQEQKLMPRTNETGFENELQRSVMDLAKANGESLVKFLTLILDKLILLMVRPPVISDQTISVCQNCFETISVIVGRIHNLLEDQNDHHGVNSVLASYIHYSCTLPHPDINAVSCLGSPTGQYPTLGRPSSLPVNKPGYQRSSSDPDLSGSTPTTPDAEVIHIMNFTKGGPLDRTGSMKGSEYGISTFPKIRGKKLVHEELAVQWVMASGSIKEATLANAWFFLNLIVKGMAEHLDKTDKLSIHRSLRFSDHFIEDVCQLVRNLIREIVLRFMKDQSLIRSLNSSLAFFLFDLLSLMDRGVVFTLINDYWRAISSQMACQVDATILMRLRLDFLHIICSHEHYFPLNLPFGTPLTPSAPCSPSPSVTSTNSQMSYASTNTLTDKGIFFDLTTEFRQQHFLSGLVLSDLATALETNFTTIHYKAINVIRNLLYNHDLDIRYSNPEIKARLAALYLPLIGIVIDGLPQLYDPNLTSRSRNSYQDEEGDRINQHVAMAIAGSSVCERVSNMNYSVQETEVKTRKCMLNADATHNLLICFVWVLKNADYAVLKSWWSELPLTRLSRIVEIIYFVVSNFEYKAKWVLMNCDMLSQFSGSEETLEDWQDSPTPRGSTYKGNGMIKSQSFHEQIWEGIQRKSQDLFRGTGTFLGRGVGKEESYGQITLDNILPFRPPRPTSATSLNVLLGKKAMSQYSQQTFRRSVDMKTRLEEAILGHSNARTEMMLRRRQTSFSNSGDRTPPSGGSEGSRLRWRKDQFQWKQPHEHYESQKFSRDVEVDAHVEGNLASEVSMVALDTLELIVQIAQSSMEMPTLGYALRVLLHSLGLNQSTAVLQHMLATQRSLVSKFPELLFQEETEQCADLCLRLLRHCSSCISNTRSHAAASLYLLMKQNFEMGNNFARVKMQVTMSLSSLVGQNQKFNEEYLRKSLKTILTYAEADVELVNTTFPAQVRDLVFNLHMILSDTVKMKEFNEDPEMLIDLMYRIAKGYQTSPDLRLTWLQTMGCKHSERKNNAEAAHCLIHAAGLVAEYLNMLEDRPHLPVGCVDFQKISSNVLEESAVSDDVVSPEEEGICTGKYFSESGLIGLLEQACGSFSMCGMYEAVNEVYKILIPIHEANRDYKRLAHIHNKLHEAFTNIIKMEGKRVFGTYFRVGFYGHKFGDLDGEEFIYKEPAITKLPEISHRLESFYEDRFGVENVVMVKDSNTVERQKQDPEKAYIQITYVEPYFDAYEMKDRVTYFEKNYNIKHFMYATPFTQNGRAHGELHEQYKRKTILTTSHAFPYVKTRLAVIHREQIILSPIEVAIEDIQKKTKELALALSQEPPDPKMLQMVLQGCIGTTVNQGPVEIALVFLKAEPNQTHGKHHNKLRLCFKEFLKRCLDALQRNKTLITVEQKEYQKEMERTFHNIRDKLYPLICSSTVTLKRAKHKSKDRARRIHSPNSSLV
ncbi:dedicator of cytokinesis protein 7 isoform X2 [Octopus bimaculoides]|uniref:dedicator of cytokinesis protein 7 isoform X2 n=1 Tax=Octopus bimaculoides TaxID=37653 RepID=UPI0022E593E0|nr:dedicator of cytokinesis protein 7 isoform X2 [Octopus bimaculoides]